MNNAVARYAYALGREGLVPEVLGRTHAVHLSPHMGSLSQSGLAFVVVGIFAVRGMDPGLTLYTWLGQFGGLSISYLMAFSAAAVFVFFRRNPGLDDNIWRTTVAPLVSAVGLLAIAVYSTSQFGFLIGNPESALRWLLPLLIPVAAVVGVASAQTLRSREPAAFALMGRHRALQRIEDENR